MNQEMKIGMRVQVTPVDNPDQKQDGLLVIISSNQRSAAVSFGDKPSFFSPGGMMVGPEGIMMLVEREREEEVYTDLIDGRKYRIEPLAGQY